MTQKFVYAATHSWSSPIRVGSHHIARAISQFGPLLYTSHPISLATLINSADNQLAGRAQLWKDGPQSIAGANKVRELTWFMPFAPGSSKLQGSELFTKLGPKICLPNPKQLLDRLGFLQAEQLWLDSFFQFYWTDIIEPAHLYVRVADHPVYITRLSKPLQRKLTETLERAELIVTPSTATADYLAGMTGSPIRFVPNGVDTQHFSAPQARPKLYEQNSGQNAVFVGAIASWIDINLLVETAKLCPEVNFWLIGPNHNQIIRDTPANLSALGSVAYDDIPAYLQHADVALAPFDVRDQPEFINSIDAIKLYEYIAAGVPAVATQWQQSERLTPHVLTSEQTPEAFRANIAEALARRSSHTASKAYVENLDWRNRLSFLENLCGASKTSN